MALPNLVGLLLLSGVVAAETRSYFERQAAGSGPAPRPAPAPPQESES
jgi:hypothetical protein